MKAIRGFFYKFSIAAELLGFLWERKLWWLIPMVVMLLFFGILIVFAQAAGVTPFIYPIF
jgi:hypothetical protein